jgi:Fe-S-cluster containining protein
MEGHKDKGIPLNDKNSEFYFPYKWDETGKCEMLINNKCSVYKNRPLICNIEKFRKKLKLQKDFFYKINAIACNQLMDEANISQELKVKIW